MSFKNLDPSKIQVSEKKTREVKNEYKGNVQFNIGITDHVLSRFAERHMNGTKLNIEQIREYVRTLVHEKGIEGFNEGETYYVALPKHGLFVVKGTNAVTFMGITDLNRFYTDIFIKLLNKARV